jgi:hypothetical protein
MGREVSGSMVRPGDAFLRLEPMKKVAKTIRAQKAAPIIEGLKVRIETARSGSERLNQRLAAILILLMDWP